jgi:hypothetical protein
LPGRQVGEGVSPALDVFMKILLVGGDFKGRISTANVFGATLGTFTEANLRKNK